MAIKYKVITLDDWMSEADLNAELRQGYELLSHGGTNLRNTNTKQINYVFVYRGGLGANRGVVRGAG